MKRKVFAGLVVLMGISILGIIAVQLVWMNNAIGVKNELFSRSVNEALNSTVRRLEDINNLDVVNRMVFSDSLFWKSETDENIDVRLLHPPGIHPVPDTFKRAPRPVHIIREVTPDGQNVRVEIKVDTGSGENQANYHYRFETERRNNNTGVVVIDEKSLAGKDVVILRKDTLVHDLDSLYKTGIVRIDSMLTGLDSFNVFLPDFPRRARLKAERLKQLATRVPDEIFEWDVRRIDEKLLQDVLSEELQNRNIPIDFRFAVFRDSLMVTTPGSRVDSFRLAGSEFKVNLYPHDVIQKNIKLAVFFPGRDSFIYRSLNWLLVASFLFSLIILLTFALSIFYILRQKKISEMKSDFINNMTHEFKTPIATISVATDSIVNEKVLGDPARIRYFAGMIKKENTRMNRQVEDILTIARLDRKEFEFNWETLNAHELIGDAIQGISLQVEKRNGSIIQELNAVNPVIVTDKNHFSNVIFNLLDNAIKYTAGEPEIRITTASKPAGILISVADNGIGMSKTVQAKIFERFYRQAGGNIHNVKGFGLGLSYVKAVVEANRGKISVHSEPGKGSRFDVFLPFVRE